MRKLIAAAAVLAVSSVQAAEELKFGDVNYFLKKGEMNFSLDVLSTYEKQRSQSESLETRGVLADAKLSHAYTDQFNVFLGLNYAYDKETENRTTSSDGAYNSDGLSNPSIGVNYRLMNQNDSRYNFDLGAVARLAIMDEEKGSATGQDIADGNNADGQHGLELNARIGRKFDEANEWQLAAGFIYNMAGEYEQLGTGTDADFDVDEDASYDVYARATYQYRPVNEFMMLLSAQATRFGKREGELNSTPSQDFEIESYIDMEFTFQAKYLITDNFIAKFDYIMGRNEDQSVDIGNTNADVKRRRENRFGLGVDFLF